MITATDLVAISGRKNAHPLMHKLADAFNKYAYENGVTTQKRIAMALANFSIESAGFTRMDENLNYSAKRLRVVWPSRFKSDASAQAYANNPQKLANKVYGGRLGNTGPNDGWLYRGSGPGQVTGKSNFANAQKETGIPFVTSPDLMRDPDMGTKAALILWRKWGMNALADKDHVTEGRKKWNGGSHGLKEVRAAYARAMKRNLSVPMVSAPAPKPSPAPPTPKPIAKPTQPPAGTQTQAAGKMTIGALIVAAGAALAAKWEALTTWIGGLF